MMTKQKFECFALMDAPPSLVPAPTERDWMDATAAQFAYRCAPMAVANASGWELLNPVGFSATWTGHNGPDSVVLRPHDYGQPLRHVSNGFGHGIITFYPGYLFRTPPGWTLWVRGGPNRIKDGVAPLDGIVETDWLPYGFTMNWKFTRPCTVHFEKDEPFCFMTLAPSLAIETFIPEIRHIQEEPELQQEFKAWERERARFATALQAGDPEACEQGWQKHYDRGISPTGHSTAGPDHRIRRTLTKPQSGRKMF